MRDSLSREGVSLNWIGLVCIVHLWRIWSFIPRGKWRAYLWGYRIRPCLKVCSEGGTAWVAMGSFTEDILMHLQQYPTESVYYHKQIIYDR